MNIKWMGGMRALLDESTGYRVVALGGDCYEEDEGTGEWSNVNMHTDRWSPDWNDPGTQGCIIDQLEDVYADRLTISISKFGAAIVIPCENHVLEFYENDLGRALKSATRALD